jgi:arginase
VPIVYGSETVAGGWDLLASPWHLGDQVPGFPVPAGAIALSEPPASVGGELDRLISRYGHVRDAVAQVDRPLVIAGDCLTALGVVAGLQRRARDVSVIWLDAHGDFNTPAISVSGYLAGMSLAMLTGRGHEQLAARLGLRAVADERAVLIDARDLDPAERDALAASRVRRLPADPETVRHALVELGLRDVYLHVDVDIIDGEDLPGLRWATPPGPSFSVVEDCLTQIVDAAPLIATCIACPWAPDRIADESARRAITRLAAVTGAELHWSSDGVRRGR